MRSRSYILAAMLLVSGLGHWLSLETLPPIPDKEQKSQPVKIKIVEKPKQKEESKQIVEAKQVETEPPKESKRLGRVDHSTEKETAPKKRSRADSLAMLPEKFKQPAQKPKPQQKKQKKVEKTKPKKDKKAQKKPEKSQPKVGLQISNSLSPEKKPVENYNDFLKSSLSDIRAEASAAAYQDYLDDDSLDDGVIDLNTQEYRYIGYFTLMRRAIELAWIYPRQARVLGLRGKVFLRFTIEPKGTVSHIAVLDSSGHDSLDRAVVDAIQLASPFPPLPPAFGEQLKIQGTFSYVLH